MEELVNFKVSDTPGADLAFDDFVIDGATLMIPDIIKVDNEVEAIRPSPFPVCPGPAALSSVEALARPTASEAWDTVDPGLAEIYTQVTAHGVPNYRGARVRVPSALNIAAWREREGDLADPSLVDCLEYGFPIGFNGSQPPVSDIPNHSSARANPAQVRKYLSTEAEHLAIAGPFTAKPFSPWYRTNPLMTRPKRDSPDLRVILDLSFPKGEGVNSAIPVYALDGAEFKLRLPIPLDLANRIRKLGRGCLLFKVDLSRAYRQLRSDPFDWPFLGVQWDSEYFVDTAVPFGLRHGASACQRTTEAVVSLAKQDNDTTAHPYIDDTVAAALPDVADDQYTGLLRLMAVLGLMAAPHKSVPPCFQLIWIGVLFNTLAMSMSIDPARIAEAVTLCMAFLRKQHTSLKELQSLVGKLMHVSKCCPPARRFTARILDLLRAANVVSPLPISDQARLDAAWFAAFLPHFNGVSLIKQETAEMVVQVDACPTGAGGICSNLGFYALPFPIGITSLSLSIASLECLTYSLHVGFGVQHGLESTSSCILTTPLRWLLLTREQLKTLSSGPRFERCG